MGLTIPANICGEMIRHLRSVWPEEGCGVILRGKQGEWSYVPIRNTADDPYCQYRLEPEAWVRTVLACERQGGKIAAIVHSHPRTPAVPSAEDLAGWNYPGVYMVIVSFLLWERPHIGIYRP
jgi:proteasome lid subunit RPN8/RPN11